MGLKGNKTLPKAVKQQVRERVLRAIQHEREASRAQKMRLQQAAAAPPVRGIYHNASLPAPPGAGSARSGRQSGKNGNKPPGKPPRARRIYFNRLHGYAAR